MNLLADESVDRQIVERLRQEGHQVMYVAETEPSVSDNIVFDGANEESALLITGDKDFGEIVFREGRLGSGGVVLLRLAGLPAQIRAEIVSDVFRERGSEFPNNFSVVAPGKVRIRPKETA